MYNSIIMEKSNPFYQKIIREICYNVPRHQLAIIHGSGNEFLWDVLQQLTNLPIHVPDVNPDHAQAVQRAIKAPRQDIFPDLIIPPIENDKKRFLRSIEAVVQREIINLNRMDDIPEIVEALSSYLLEMGQIAIVLRDFYTVCNPEIKEIVSQVIQQTKNVHWLIATNQLLDIPDQHILIWHNQLYRISLDIGLTTCQFDLFLRLVNGQTINEIAKVTRPTKKTLQNRRTGICKRLSLKTNFDLARFAAKNGLFLLDV